MPDVTAEKLAEALNIIMNSGQKEEKKEDPAQAEAPAPEKLPTKEELRAEVLAELRKEAEENKKKAEEAEDKVDHAAERENKFINKSLVASVERHGVSSDVVESLSGFLEYDTLKNDEGEADEEKINSLATLISNISNRKPPKSGSKRDVFDDGGFAKYLPKS